jgi:hypothetical protein
MTRCIELRHDLVHAYYYFKEKGHLLHSGDMFAHFIKRISRDTHGCWWIVDLLITRVNYLHSPQ